MATDREVVDVEAEGEAGDGGEHDAGHEGVGDVVTRQVPQEQVHLRKKLTRCDGDGP